MPGFGPHLCTALFDFNLARAFNVSTPQSGLLISAYAIGDAVTALIAGPLSDGRGRKKIMIGGLAFFAIGTLACGLSTNFVEMLIFEFVSGVASAFVAPQVYATVPTVVAGNKVAPLMGFSLAGLSSSPDFRDTSRQLLGHDKLANFLLLSGSLGSDPYPCPAVQPAGD